MVWINIPELSKRCERFIEENSQLKIAKYVCRNGTFVFYREYVNVQKIKYETADFRICLVKNETGVEGWSVDYMRHNGKWQNLPIFGDFDECLHEIKKGKWDVLNPLQ